MVSKNPSKVVIIGAGVGGLTTAALLARVGLDVTVLEAHVYPGGCAGTFYYQGYRFDAGATLAGGFSPQGPMDRIASATGIASWPVRHTEPAMVVHLPDGMQIHRWGDDRRWEARRAAFGNEAEKFWFWQEKTADALWDLTLRNPTWPPQTIGDGFDLAQILHSWSLDISPGAISPSLILDAVRPLGTHLRKSSARLRTFIDAQLLISAQTTSMHANALYAAAALDLPRRGVGELQGGMGAIAEALAQAVVQNGGKVLYRHRVTRVHPASNGQYLIETKRRGTIKADLVIFNVPPWNITSLLGEYAPRKVRTLPSIPKDGWGAFMLYIGLDQTAAEPGLPSHHQIVAGERFGEGNTIFLSLSPSWDLNRAPEGNRALTISTHTDFRPWWTLYNQDPERYRARQQTYTDKILAVAETVIPHLREATQLILPGTPVTFHRFTQRAWGWVGGFPQTHLFRPWGPRLSKHLWLVGDSIFPGQSTPAVALGGLRVAKSILKEFGIHKLASKLEPCPELYRS